MRNKKNCAGPAPRLLPMDELQNRPCEVDGRPALFHRWIEEDRVLLVIDAMVPLAEQSILAYSCHEMHVVRPGSHADVIRETFALVEYPDGVVAKVKPELVRFVV
jgi:hypothetical protein